MLDMWQALKTHPSFAIQIAAFFSSSSEVSAH